MQQHHVTPEDFTMSLQHKGLLVPVTRRPGKLMLALSNVCDYITFDILALKLPNPAHKGFDAAAAEMT